MTCVCCVRILDHPLITCPILRLNSGKDAIRLIKKKLSHENPNVIVLTLTVRLSSRCRL